MRQDLLPTSLLAVMECYAVCTEIKGATFSIVVDLSQTRHSFVPCLQKKESYFHGKKDARKLIRSLTMSFVWQQFFFVHTIKRPFLYNCVTRKSKSIWNVGKIFRVNCGSERHNTFQSNKFDEELWISHKQAMSYNK